MKKLAVRIADRIELFVRAVVVVTSVAVLVMMIASIIDVLRRAIFDRPVAGVLESSELLLVIVVFAGLAYCQQEKSHVSVDLLVTRLGGRKKAGVAVVTLLLSLVFIGLIAHSSILAAYSSTAAGEFTHGLVRFPRWPGKIVIAVGMLLLWLQLCIQLARAISHWLSLRSES